MLERKRWNWELAFEGMPVTLIDLYDSQYYRGSVSKVKRNNNIRLIGSKPNRNSKVMSVNVLLEDGTEITVERDSSQYQLKLD